MTSQRCCTLRRGRHLLRAHEPPASSCSRQVRPVRRRRPPASGDHGEVPDVGPAFPPCALCSRAFLPARPGTAALPPCVFSAPTFHASRFPVFSLCSRWKCPPCAVPSEGGHRPVPDAAHTVWWCFCGLPEAEALFVGESPLCGSPRQACAGLFPEPSLCSPEHVGLSFPSRNSLLSDTR